MKQENDYESLEGMYQRKEFLTWYNIYKSDQLKNDVYFKVYDYLLSTGYDPEKINTIMYTYFIVEVYRNLDKKNMVEQLIDPFSQFYLDLQNTNVGMKPKSFHSHILGREYEGSIQDILAVETYGLEALRIAKDLKENKVLEKVKSTI